MKEEGRDTLLRKRKVLHLLSQWSSLCADLPRDDEHTKLFLKVRMERGGNYFWKYKNATTPAALDYLMPHNEREMARLLLASEDL